MHKDAIEHIKRLKQQFAELHLHRVTLASGREHLAHWSEGPPNGIPDETDVFLTNCQSWICGRAGKPIDVLHETFALVEYDGGEQRLYCKECGEEVRHSLMLAANHGL
jgi:hypothetical protein